MPIIAGMPGQELLAHQDHAIARAERLVGSVPAATEGTTAAAG
jgi:hypothetical protein